MFLTIKTKQNNHTGNPVISTVTFILEKFYQDADKSLAQPNSRCFILWWEYFFDASFVIYINSTNIPPIMIINRIYEHQNLLSL